MFPTLKNLQEVEIVAMDLDKLISRGSVVVFSLDNDDTKPTDQKLWHIKRVIGLPGEQVIFRNGSVWIKNSSSQEFKLDESYLQNDSTYKLGIKNYATSGKENHDYFESVLKDYEYFLLGDNRTASYDSRNTGPATREQIKYEIV